MGLLPVRRDRGPGGVQGTTGGGRKAPPAGAGVTAMVQGHIAGDRGAPPPAGPAARRPPLPVGGSNTNTGGSGKIGPLQGTSSPPRWLKARRR